MAEAFCYWNKNKLKKIRFQSAAKWKRQVKKSAFDLFGVGGEMEISLASRRGESNCLMIDGKPFMETCFVVARSAAPERKAEQIEIVAIKALMS